MSFSTIIKKPCKYETCKRYPVISLNGYCWEHAPEEIRSKYKNRLDLARKNKNKRNATILKLRKAENSLDDSYKVKLDLWFRARHYEMTGFCNEEGCNKTTNKDNRYYRWSVCHLVPKSLVPSVSLHSQNWLELCQDHHNLYDSNFEAASNMKIFAEAKRKFKLFEKDIPNDELRKINPHLF